MTRRGDVTITCEGWSLGEDCDSGFFRVEGAPASPPRVEVRTTRQIEHLLAHQLGKESLSEPEREAILEVGGHWLIDRRLIEVGHVEEVLLLDSDIFRHHGEERELLREAGLLRGKPEHPQP